MKTPVFIISSWMLRPGMARAELLKQQFKVNAPKADGAVLHAFADDILNDHDEDITFGLSCLAPGTPVHIALFPANNDMGIDDYAGAVHTSAIQVQQAGMIVHGARLCYMINSIVPGGTAFGLPDGETLAGLGLTAEVLAQEVDDAATLLFTVLPETAVLSFPIWQPHKAWGDNSEAISAQLRVAARSTQPSRAVTGQLAFPAGYGPGGPLLGLPPCFTQLPTQGDWRSLTQEAEGLGLLWIERHQDQWPT